MLATVNVVDIGLFFMRLYDESKTTSGEGRLAGTDSVHQAASAIDSRERGEEEEAAKEGESNGSGELSLSD